MWFCFNDGFISTVIDPAKPGNLVVRARRKEHLRALFPGRMPISRTPNRDYRWRVSVPRRMLADVVAARVMAISYDNFKDSVEDRDLHDMYSLWWGDHHRLQASNWRMNDG